LYKWYSFQLFPSPLCINNIIMTKFRWFILIAVVIFFSSWGYLVHRTIHQLAIYKLPAGLQTFFYNNKETLVLDAPRPDQRRFKDSTEANKHFIDLEYYSEADRYHMPQTWDEAIKKFPADTLRKYGTSPYNIIAVYDKLVRAFRNREKDSILFYAADLGHYIADAHVPLHTSLNYDGQLTHQQGVHDLWETTVPELVLNEYNLYSKKKAKYIASIPKATWDIVYHTHSLLPDLFATELEVSKQFTDSTKYQWQFRWGKNRRFYSSDFARVYNQKLKHSINKQLLLSAENIASFWYSAWVDAGKPDLTSLNTKAVDAQQLKGELKLYKKNKLIETKQLIAKEVKTDD
jgi:hypothetical protein